MPSHEVVRKKFATPPVKLACTNCRASRIRCDGKDTCTACLNKGKQCVYTTSRRGGPRIHTRRRNSNTIVKNDSNTGGDPFIFTGAGDDFQEASSLQYAGAGLRHLDPITDEQLFEDLLTMDFNDFANMPIDPSLEQSFTPSQNDNGSSSLSSFSPSSSNHQPINQLRIYDSEEAILDAYYVYIHTYFPILPPPLKFPATDRLSTTGHYYEPQSPLSTAISAILALIPHPEESDSTSPSSVTQRRDQAQQYAQLAIHKLDAESELSESATCPSRALQGQPSIQRLPFHPQTPIDLESILALLVLSVYEYAQRGNIPKMRIRSSHALAAAMDMSLYQAEEDGDVFAEAKRRAWWMTFTCACQSFIVSNTVLNVNPDDPRFLRPLPSNGADSLAWDVFLKAQKYIAKVTESITKLNAGLKSGTDLTPIFTRMQELDKQVKPLVSQCDSWADTTANPTVMSVFPTEAILATALRGMTRIKLNSARIKLHRYCAFTDVPIFSEKHCDLTATDGTNPQHNTPPCCASLDNLRIEPSLQPNSLKLPFKSTSSAAMCRQSALNIVAAFRDLPFPNPSGSVDMPSKKLSSASILESPRTMPAFACCAMQSSYALLMLTYRSRAASKMRMGGDEHYKMLADNFENELIKGLGVVVGVLENYSMAFEALGGMRDQVGSAVGLIRVGASV